MLDNEFRLIFCDNEWKLFHKQDFYTDVYNICHKRGDISIKIKNSNSSNSCIVSKCCLIPDIKVKKYINSKVFIKNN